MQHSPKYEYFLLFKNVYGQGYYGLHYVFVSIIVNALMFNAEASGRDETDLRLLSRPTDKSNKE